MCSIVGSFDIDRLRQLAELNAYRGTHSHSLYAFDSNKNVVYSHRSFGALDINKHAIETNSNLYFVAHQQAPTTDAKSVDSIHPAQVQDTLLWHNGIIKEDDVIRLKDELLSDEVWDTKLMLLNYLKSGSVDNIDGTFSCLLYNENKLHLFRNEISPMFYNEQGDISSTKFEGGQPTSPNFIIEFEPFDDNLMTLRNQFVTKENPYFFM